MKRLRLTQLGLSLLAAAVLTAGAFAQQQTQQQVQPARADQALASQQHSWQIENVQRQLDTVFDRLLDQASEEARQEVEQIQNELNRLIDNVLADVDTMGRQQMAGATTDQQRIQQLEQRLDALERQTRGQRALDRARRDLGNLRGDITMGTDNERTAQELSRIRSDLERAFEGTGEVAQQRWTDLRNQFETFTQRLHDQETIGEEEFDQFLRGFDEDFEIGTTHDRPIAYQLDPNVSEQRRRAITGAQARLEGLRGDITADVLDRERISQELEDIRSNLESFFEQQYRNFQEAGAADRDWWMVVQVQWIDLEEQLRTDAPTAGIAETYATLLENLHQHGLQAAQQQRQQGLEQARSRLEEIRGQQADESSREFRAGEIAQLRAQLRQQFRDAEGENQQTWNRLRRQLVDVEQQIRAGESVDDATWDEIMEGLPEEGNGNGM